MAAQQALFKALVVTVGHFFGSFAQLFGALTEPRDPARLTYPLPVLMATGVLMFLLRLGARRQIAALLRANGPSQAKCQAWLEVVSTMVATLIRRKLLYAERLLERYYLLAVNGTGFLPYAERHCPHCLTRTQHGHTTYYHKGVGSVKNIAFRLLEAWRNLRLSPAAVQSLLNIRLQIRFNPP